MLAGLGLAVSEGEDPGRGETETGGGMRPSTPSFDITYACGLGIGDAGTAGNAAGDSGNDNRGRVTGWRRQWATHYALQYYIVQGYAFCCTRYIITLVIQQYTLIDVYVMQCLMRVIIINVNNIVYCCYVCVHVREDSITITITMPKMQRGVSTVIA